MGTALQIDVTFDQILSIVKQLPKQEKLKLTEELEKEITASRLSKLLRDFKTDDLDLEVINAEVELVRQSIYNEKNA